MKILLIVLGVLLLAVAFVFVDHHLDVPSQVEQQRAQLLSIDRSLNLQDTGARISPVGKVRVAAAAGSSQAVSPAPAAKTGKKAEMMVAVAAVKVEAKPAAAGRSAETVYQTVCMACHIVGVANAPKTGDKAAWQARAAAGLDAMVQAVITGKGAMPPKAANPTLTKEEITATVKWFLEQAGVNAG